MPLRSTTKESAEAVEKLGVGLSRNQDGSLHVGLLYRHEAAVWYCHLAFHLSLRKEAAARFAGGWSEVGLPPLRRHALAAGLVDVVRQADAQQIPYSFNMRNCHFDKDGRFIQDGPGAGLTCATFVMAYFASMGVILFRQETWRARASDEDWQRRVLNLLERHFPDERAHIEAMRGFIGVFRYRPEEVAAAAQMSMLPLEFERAEEAGRQALTELG